MKTAYQKNSVAIHKSQYLIVERVIFFVIIGLIATFITSYSYAASGGFSQNDWSGGASSNIPNATSNQTGWTEYSSLDADLEVTVFSLPPNTVDNGDGTYTTTLQPDAVGKDSYVESNLHTTNNGDSSQLVIQNDRSSFNFVQVQRRTFIEFDISSLPSFITITDAVFSLYFYEVNAPAQTMDVHRVGAAWDESTINFGNQPGAGSLVDTKTAPGVGTVDWNVTPAVIDWANGVANFGLRVAMPTATPVGIGENRINRARSSDSGTAKRPKLAVTYILPAPVSIRPTVISNDTFVQTSKGGGADIPNVGGFNAGSTTGGTVIVGSGADSSLTLSGQFDIGDGHNGAITISGTGSINNPVSWYKFNEINTSDPVIDAIAGNNATNNGAAIVAGQGGNYDNAFSFDSTDHIITNSNYAAHQLTDMTLSAWVNPGATSTWRPIFRRGENGELNYRLQIYPNASNWIVFDFNTSAGFLSWTCTTCSLASGVWSHLALTYDVASGNAIIYINGAQAGTNAFPAGAIPNATGVALPNLYIGRDIRQDTQYVGEIDEVRIFNQALLPGEVASEAAGAYLMPPSVVNVYAAIDPAGISAGSNSITLDPSDSTTGFTSGDEIMIIQMSHDTDISRVGVFEFKKNITVVDGSTLSFAGDPLIHSYDGASSGGRAQVVLVPNYTDVTIQTASALGYDVPTGKGGIFILRASGNAQIDGTVNTKGRGYWRGEGIPELTNEPGYQGYGPIGASNAQDITDNSGGGGGGGQQGHNLAERQAGGGGGGHATPGIGGLGWNDLLVGGTQSSQGGLGGDSYGNSYLTRLTMGSAGGSGSAPGDYQFSGQGGKGGGIVYIAANSITFGTSGIIQATGRDGGAGSNFGGGGGGGAGGSIYLGGNTISGLGSNKVIAYGGVGGTGGKYRYDGGDGGNGSIRIEVTGGTVSGSTNPAASIGNTAAPNSTFTSALIPVGTSTVYGALSWLPTTQPAGTSAQVSLEGVNPNSATMLPVNGTLTIGSAGSQTTTEEAWSNAQGANAKLGGQAISLDGDDAVQVSWAPLVGNSPNSSVEAWVYWDGSAGDQMIYTENANNDASFIWRLRVLNGVAIFDIFESLTTTWHLAADDVAIPVNTWTHLVGTLSSTDGMKIYVNGVVEGTNSHNEAWDGGWGPIVSSFIGAGRFGAGTSAYFFSGRIDEVAVYNIALDSTTISARYNNGLGAELSGNEPGLIMVWHLNEGTGNTAFGANGSSTGFINIANGQYASFLDGFEYIRYRVSLDATSAAPAVFPGFDSLNLDYSANGYPIGTYDLVSSPFDTEDNDNSIVDWQWLAQTPSLTGVNVQVRTSPDAATWTNWTDVAPNGESILASVDASFSSPLTQSLTQALPVFGQTFVTSADAEAITSIHVGLREWSVRVDEVVTLSVWNSVAKTTLLGSETVERIPGEVNAGPNNTHIFSFTSPIPVAPNTQYYFELVYSGWLDSTDTVIIGLTVEGCEGCMAYRDNDPNDAIPPLQFLRNLAFVINGTTAEPAIFDGIDDQYLQYRAQLSTQNQVETPTLQLVNVDYATYTGGSLAEPGSGDTSGLGVAKGGGATSGSNNFSSSGGGSFGWLSLFVMLLYSMIRLSRKRTMQGVNLGKV